GRCCEKRKARSENDFSHDCDLSVVQFTVVTVTPGLWLSTVSFPCTMWEAMLWMAPDPMPTVPTTNPVGEPWSSITLRSKARVEGAFWNQIARCREFWVLTLWA